MRQVDVETPDVTDIKYIYDIAAPGVFASGTPLGASTETEEEKQKREQMKQFGFYSGGEISWEDILKILRG